MRPKKHEAWEKLVREMNRTVDECKENLLSVLRREEIKVEMKKSSGTGSEVLLMGILLYFCNAVYSRSAQIPTAR
jgi:hypothetical protein